MRSWRRLTRDYGLSLFVGVLFLVSFLLHAVFGWLQYAADQKSHGDEATFWGDSGYVVYFGEWTFQNWQSEFLEVIVLIVASSYLIHKGSAESKDSDDEMKAILERIEKRLDELDAGGGDDGRKRRTPKAA